eukprot:3498752-Rhodomonas_salina.2
MALYQGSATVKLAPLFLPNQRYIQASVDLRDPSGRTNGALSIRLEWRHPSLQVRDQMGFWYKVYGVRACLQLISPRFFLLCVPLSVQLPLVQLGQREGGRGVRCTERGVTGVLRTPRGTELGVWRYTAHSTGLGVLHYNIRFSSAQALLC